jgi:REP element-mobilizing transposase RayT
MYRRKNSLRLKNFNYSSARAYFITICTYERTHLLGKINNGKMILNLFGQIVSHKWKNIPRHFKNAQLFEFQIMPDHIHGIICLMNKINNCTRVGVKHSRQDFSKKSVNNAKNASLLQPWPYNHGTKPGSISAIIQKFSSITTRKINQIRHTPGSKLWQRGYYDRIIRNKEELIAIQKYIINNPENWK